MDFVNNAYEMIAGKIGNWIDTAIKTLKKHTTKTILPFLSQFVRSILELKAGKRSMSVQMNLGNMQ